MLKNQDNDLSNLVKVLAEEGYNLEPDGGDGLFLLSASIGKSSLLDVCLKAGADVDMVNSFKETALHKAAESGKEEVVALLLQHGANANLQDDFGCTPLFLAALHGHEKVADLLVAAKVDLNMKGQDIRSRSFEEITPLFTALVNGHEALAITLVCAGAKLNEKCVGGKTALIWALENNKGNVVEALIEAGANLNLKDKDGMTALMRAAQYAKASTVQLLIDAGAKLDVKHRDGAVAWMFAGAIGVIDLFMEAGVDFKADMPDAYEGLRLSAGLGHEGLLNIFMDELNLRGEFDSSDKRVLSALIKAAGSGRRNIVKIFLEKGVDINAGADTESTEWQSTPLQYALLNNHRTLAKQLVEAGANVNIICQYGRTDLMQAIEKGSEDVVEAMFDSESAFPRLNHQDTWGNTALHYAAREGLLMVTELLMRAGARIDIRNQKDETPLKIAEEAGFEALVQVLG